MPILAKTLNKMYLLSFIGFLAFSLSLKRRSPLVTLEVRIQLLFQLDTSFCVRYFQKNNL